MVSGAPGDDPARAVCHGRAVERAEASGPAALEATVLRLRSLEALDVALALATSGRERDYRAWSERVAAEVTAGRAIGDELDPRWAATVGQILARSMLEPSAEVIALAIYGELAARFGSETLEPRDAQTYGQLLLESGADELLRACLPHLDLQPVIHRMLLTDLVRLDVAAGRRPLTAWSAALQDLLQVGSPGFELPDDPDPFRFDELRSQVDGEPVDGPLITVVMPVFAPDAGLVTAVRSILDQTWQHLEVLIVDDASPPATRHLFEEVETLDDRIRVISKPRNGGTYAARNTALAAARGLFVTGQDADDWSHPERLERQVRPLLEDRALVATVSRCLRVTDDLRTSSLRASGSSPVRMNSSSLLFRRTEVMHRMGYYDRVRKGADSEFIFRMRAVFGKQAVRELPECLALVRLVTGSLSRADFLPGWQHESRVWYRELYTHWHRRISDGGDPFLAIDRRERPFPTPVSFLAGDSGRLEVDDLLVADLRDPQPGQERLLGIARQLAAQGRRIGLAHLERFDTLEPSRRSLDPTILGALFEGEFELVEWAREVSVEHVIIWPAELPEFHGERQTRWRTDRVSLVVEDALPLSAVPASLLRWQRSASWAARNLRMEDRIGLVAPGAREPATARPAEGERGLLRHVGWVGRSSDRLEVVLVGSADHPAPLARFASVEEALAGSAVSVRLASHGKAVDTLAHARAVEVDDESNEPLVSGAESDGLCVFAAVAHEHGSRDNLRFVPIAGPETSARPLSRSGAGSSPEVSQRPRRGAEVRAAAPQTLPFVAVAGELGVQELRDWANHTVDGVQYWFPVEGTAVVVPLAMQHRLRSPSCAVAIRRGNAGTADLADEWSDLSRDGIEDPASALESLRGDRAPAALAVHDSHVWTVHSTAPAELTCARDAAGHLCAVATEEQVLSAFLSALSGRASSDRARPADDRVGRLLDGDWRHVPSGWVRGRAVAFSALHGHEFLPGTELALLPAL